MIAESGRRDRGGLGVATAIVVAALLVVVGVAVVVSRSQPQIVFDLDVGDCFEIPTLADEGSGVATIDHVDTVGCDTPGRAMVMRVGQLNPEQNLDYPSDDELAALTDQACAGSVTDPDEGLVPIMPNEASWRPLGGRFVCLALPYGA